MGGLMSSAKKRWFSVLRLLKERDFQIERITEVESDSDLEPIAEEPSAAQQRWVRMVRLLRERNAVHQAMAEIDSAESVVEGGSGPRRVWFHLGYQVHPRTSVAGHRFLHRLHR